MQSALPEIFDLAVGRTLIARSKGSSYKQQNIFYSIYSTVQNKCTKTYRDFPLCELTGQHGHGHLVLNTHSFGPL